MIRYTISVASVAAVNAVGDVRDAEGRIVAGARAADGSWLDGAAFLAHGQSGADPFGELAGRSTTLCVVATNAALDRAALHAQIGRHTSDSSHNGQSRMPSSA